jgi:hypothetical protein
MPVSHLIASRKRMSVATEHPRQPSMNIVADAKKQTLLPNISEKRP